MKRNFAALTAKSLGVLLGCSVFSFSQATQLQVNSQNTTFVNHTTSVSNNLSSRIIGGDESKFGDWPSVAALVKADETNYNGQFCGGTYIGAKFVLTAAHCLDDLLPNQIDVVLGAHDLSENDGQRYDVNGFIIHALYDNESLDYDIAIIELVETPTNIPIQSLSRSAVSNFSGLDVGSLMTAIGWGTTSVNSSQYPNVLNQVNVPLVDKAICQGLGDSYANIGNDVFCAGYQGGSKDSCQGDSGGPIFFNDNGAIVQVGIISWGEGCAEQNAYGVYADVGYLSPWIEQFTAGLTYIQSQDLGIKLYEQSHKHTFTITNNTTQAITFSTQDTDNAGVTGVNSNDTVDNQCLRLVSSGTSCDVTVDFYGDEFGKYELILTLDTDHQLYEDITLGANYHVAQEASDSLEDKFAVTNGVVYSGEFPWIADEEKISPQLVSANEQSVLIVDRIPTGTISFDLALENTTVIDGLQLFINGIEKTDINFNGANTYFLAKQLNQIEWIYRSSNSRVAAPVSLSRIDYQQYEAPAAPAPTNSGGGGGGSLNMFWLILIGWALTLRNKNII